MIYELLKERRAIGNDRAISLEKLAHLTGITERSVMLRVEKERRAGKLICSTSKGNHGYYLPECTEDLKAFVRQQNSRMKAHRKVILPFIRAIRTDDWEKLA